VVLAEILQVAIPAALASHEHRRKPRAKRVQQQSLALFPQIRQAPVLRSAFWREKGEETFRLSGQCREAENHYSVLVGREAPVRPWSLLAGPSSAWGPGRDLVKKIIRPMWAGTLKGARNRDARRPKRSAAEKRTRTMEAM